MADRRYWSEYDIAALQNNNGVLSTHELALLLKRSVHSVERGLKRYGGTSRRIKRAGIRTEWTEDLQNELVRLLKTEPPNAVAKQLGLALPVVLTKIRVMDLGYIKAKRAWTKADVVELLRLAEYYGRAEIAKRTKRGIGSVNCKMIELGLKSFHGSYSMRGAERHTGYHHETLMRARDALNQQWKYRKWRNKGRFVITDDQLNAMCEWLKQERWPRQQAA
jgi:hypothetical protein